MCSISSFRLGVFLKTMRVDVCFMFEGTNRYFRKVAERLNITTTFVDATNVQLVKEALRPNTKVAIIDHSKAMETIIFIGF